MLLVFLFVFFSYSLVFYKYIVLSNIRFLSVLLILQNIGKSGEICQFQSLAPNSQRKSAGSDRILDLFLGEIQRSAVLQTIRQGLSPLIKGRADQREHQLFIGNFHRGINLFFSGKLRVRGGKD